MYTYFEENGNDYAVNTLTGEGLDAIKTIVPVGSRIITPEQQEAYKKRKEIERLKAQRIEQDSDLGYFYFLRKDHETGKISADTLGRLIYLLTYLDYDGNLMLSQRKPMKKSDLENVMGLSRSTVWRFWQEINGRYIVETDGVLKLSNNDVIRGKLCTDGHVYQKFYINAIRKLYRRIKKTSHHKYLGYVYMTLPYINLEFNIICHNPDETNLKAVKPMSIGEFCNKIGYDAGNFDRLRKIYSQITFDVDEEEQYFLSFVMNNYDANSIRMFVNPRILYSGSNYKDVEMLGVFCKKTKQKQTDEKNIPML